MTRDTKAIWDNVRRHAAGGPDRIKIWRGLFLWKEENRSNWRKTLGARRQPTTNSTHIWHQVGIVPGTHWLEASDPTTARSLLPNYSVPPWNFRFLTTACTWPLFHFLFSIFIIFLSVHSLIFSPLLWYRRIGYIVIYYATIILIVLQNQL